jgi:phosphatidylglycerol:prolipoprotein diacylglycerol transferase
MHPVVATLELGERVLPIGSYGLCLCLGLFVSALGSLWAAQRAGLELGACIAVAGATVLGAFGGAFVLHSLVQWFRLGSLPLALQAPGMAFLGALLGGGGVALWSARQVGLPGLLLLDVSVPFLALGHAIGRVGCLLGGCCYGEPWAGALAVRYTSPLAPAAWPSVARHPVPAYESALLLGLCALLWLRPAREPGSGRQLLRYVSGYALLRAALETLRGDAVRGLYLGGLASSAQVLAAVLLCACAWLALRSRAALR